MKNLVCSFLILFSLFLPFPGEFGEAAQKKAMGRLPPPAVDEDFYDGGAPDSAKVELGRFLFFDKILSGNKNTSCATCHHALTDSGDGLSLPAGEGGRGLGVARGTGSGGDLIYERVPRNAPPIFNLGASEFRRMFHDGRVEVDPDFPYAILSPAGNELPPELENVLAAQAMFPPTSPAEMCGQQGENALTGFCAEANFKDIWKALAERLRSIPEYVELFVKAFPEKIEKAEGITFAHAANAIAAFEASAWRADGSPFDRFLRGDMRAMSAAAIGGMRLFYGEAECASCHSGTFLTDHDFHAVAMPQIGPGKGDGDDGREDYGRERVTGRAEDRYRFRTPSLRNLALTGPWGHAGAFDTVVRHFLDPVSSIYDYDPAQAVLPRRKDLDAIDFTAMKDPKVVESIAAANEKKKVELGKEQVAELIEFLHALTSRDSIDLRKHAPRRVPSGLPLAD